MEFQVLEVNSVPIIITHCRLERLLSLATVSSWFLVGSTVALIHHERHDKTMTKSWIPRSGFNSAIMLLYGVSELVGWEFCPLSVCCEFFFQNLLIGFRSICVDSTPGIFLYGLKVFFCFR